jgi:outer membrane protein OmpA-like peptidoglycan-associated protein
MIKWLSLVFILVLLVTSSLTGQYSTENRRAIGRYESARMNYQVYNYTAAEADLLAALEAAPSFTEAYLLLGQVYTDTRQIDKSIRAYEQALAIDPVSFPKVMFFLGVNQLSVGLYKDAKKNFEKFLATGYMTEELRVQTRKNIIDCEFAIKAMMNPVPFNPINLGPNINSENDEYWPSLSADECILVFTVLLPVKSTDPKFATYKQEDFYYSTRENGIWSKAKDAGYPLNTTNNEGAQTITGDGQVMFFTGCMREDGYGLCDIYVSENIGKTWSEPVNIGPVINTGYSEKQPSVSSDGRTLYFISDRPGGYGNYDIWCSHRAEDGSWLAPVNLGDSINTQEIDQSPFIHPDNKTLYFSSDGWPGMGGFDLFVSRIKESGTWSTPVNLGYPINTQFHEEGLIVNATGNKAYFSSNRVQGKGRDIFEFDLYEKVRPILVSYMKGTVYDAVSLQKLEAEFELIDLKTGSVIIKSNSRPVTGQFLICIPADADYALNISKKGYLFYSDNFTMDKVYQQKEPFLIDIPLQPLNVGTKTVLRNVFFETDSANLIDASRIELDIVLEFLNSNPTLTVEISGHTDNIGTAAYNQKLSDKRAASVVQYLRVHGISENRISSKGYGMSQPVESNDTPRGRAANRRTELKILSD